MAEAKKKGWIVISMKNDADRVVGDNVWALHLVRRRARHPGLPNVRHSALSVAACRKQVN